MLRTITFTLLSLVLTPAAHAHEGTHLISSIFETLGGILHFLAHPELYLALAIFCAVVMRTKHKREAK